MPGLLAHKIYNPASQAVYTLNNQELEQPVMSRVDATNLVLPAFTTGPVGRIFVVLTCYVIASPTSADNFMRWCLMTDATTVVAPGDTTAGLVGREVALQDGTAQTTKLECEAILSPLTTYTLYWGAGCGNQVAGQGAPAAYIMKAGGANVFGPATMEIWDLDS